ncbi:UNVERIFIED_CONTAM: hypothetical protein GTU68_027863, partial [Idotea baltica]|nr:hypothetical protein [Idotea baltica]
MKAGDKIKLMQSGAEHEIYKVGVFTPHPAEVKSLACGEVGYFSASIKNLRDVKIGDTVILLKDTESIQLDGFKEVKPMVFGGLFPVDADDYSSLRTALEKLSLNDASFTFEPESSVALGFGFRCGYLGLLHMEIIQERLEREFELDLITTAPSVIYSVKLTDGSIIQVENPTELPDMQEIDEIQEPLVKATVHCPKEYVGNVLALCEEKRGMQESIAFHGEDRAVIIYTIPLNEIVLDFHDKLKSRTKGYASFDYEFQEYKAAKLVRLDIKLNGDNVDALSIIVHREYAESRGRVLAEKLKELMDRQMFDIAI